MSEGKSVHHESKNTERKILRESNGYVLIEGEDYTGDLLGDFPELVDVRNEVMEALNISEQDIEGVMFNKTIQRVHISIKPELDKPGETFVALSSKGSSKVSTSDGIELTRSAYTVLDKKRGYVQRKPCGERFNDLPFYLSVPPKDFENLTGRFEPNEDLANLYIQEVDSDIEGPITKHMLKNWEVINGMLASEGRRELMNGLRFAQLHKKAFGEYPTSQIPLGIKKITDIAMPDGMIKPIAEVFEKTLDSNPLELSILKSRLLLHEHRRLQEQGAEKGAIVSGLKALKQELDAQPTSAVAQRFLDEDPFVQVVYHAPTFVRLAYDEILWNSADYRIIQTLAGGEKASPQDVLSQTILLHKTMVSELCRIAGEDVDGLHFPDIETYKSMAKKKKDIAFATGEWISETGRLNTELFTKIIETEMEKMVKAKAVANSVGEVLYASAWKSNLIGGSPCDWDWVDNSLPLPNQERKFSKRTMINNLYEENRYIHDDIYHLYQLLGLSKIGKPGFEDSYPERFSQARKACVESENSDLAPEYRQQLLEQLPTPYFSPGSSFIQFR